MWHNFLDGNAYYLLLVLRKVVLIDNGLQGDCQVSLVLLDETATLAPKSAIYCSLSQVPDQTQLQP